MAKVAQRQLYIIHILLKAYLVCCLLLAATTVYFVHKSHIVGPTGDFWFFIPFMSDYFAGKDSLSGIVKPFGGHRLVISKLLYLLEYGVFSAKNIFLVIVSLFLHLSLIGLIIREFMQCTEFKQEKSRCFMVGTIIALGFSATQIVNFTRAWNVHYFVTITSMGYAVFCFLQYYEAFKNSQLRRSCLWLGLVLLTGLISTYSTGNGLLVWPVLLLSALSLRMPKKQILLFVILLLVGVCPYFINFTGGYSDINPENGVLQKYSLIFKWLAIYFGSPLTQTFPGFEFKVMGIPVFGHRIPGMIVGFVSMLVSLILCARFIFSGHERNRLEVFLSSILLFCWGTALVTAIGRLQFYPASNNPPKYQTIVLLYWISTLGLIQLFITKQLKAKIRIRKTVQGILMASVFCWIIFAIVPNHFKTALNSLVTKEHVVEAQTALIANIEPFQSRQALYEVFQIRDRIDHSIKYREFLITGNLGYYSGNIDRFLGQEIFKLENTRLTDSCGGQQSIDYEYKDRWDKTVIRLSGTSPERSTRGILLITDNSGKVVSIGTGLKRYAFPYFTDMIGPYKFWSAYLNPPVDSEIQVWYQLEDDVFCRLHLLTNL